MDENKPIQTHHCEISESFYQRYYPKAFQQLI